MAVGIMGFLFAPQLQAQEAILKDDATVLIAARTAAGSRQVASYLHVVGPLGSASEQDAFLQFDFSQLPPGTTGSNITAATLVLYVNKLKRSGSVDIVSVNGTWGENTITSANVPIRLQPEAVNVKLGTNEFTSVDLTALVQDWVSGAITNSPHQFYRLMLSP